MRKRNFKFRPKIDKQLDEYLCRKYTEGTLNIHQEAKRLKISRMSIYRHLHQAGLIKKKVIKEEQEQKKKGFWEKIKNYFKTNSYWGQE
jgi:predicted ArsR family transcriptional regulator